MDGLDAEDSYHGYLGSTQNDRNDMDRMGKAQELRVSDHRLSEYKEKILIEVLYREISDPYQHSLSLLFSKEHGKSY